MNVLKQGGIVTIASALLFVGLLMLVDVPIRIAVVYGMVMALLVASFAVIELTRF